MYHFLIFVCFCFFVQGLSVPQQLNVLADTHTQQLCISWLGGAAKTFDLLILRTEFNETVFYVRTFLSILI